MNKKFISSVLAALMIAGTTSFTTFASMEIGTVVIGSKAFDLAYANDPVNLTEITNAIVAGGAIYIKDFEGNWVNNTTGFKVDKSVIPAVVYKSADKELNFEAEDKDEVNILAEVINITSASNATSVVNGGTLQMSAAITPVNATNKAIVWSVTTGTGTATIDTAGLLKATGVGTVTVNATNSASGVNKAMAITVTSAVSYGGGGGSYTAPTVATVRTETELNAALGNSSITTITLGASFLASPNVTRPLTMNFGGYTLTGNVSFSYDGSGISALTGDVGNRITGNLTVNTPYASFKNGVEVSEVVYVVDVEIGTWTESADGNTLIITDSNGAKIIVTGDPGSVTVTEDASGELTLTVNSGATITNISSNAPINIVVAIGARVTNITTYLGSSGSTITNNGTIDTIIGVTGNVVVGGTNDGSVVAEVPIGLAPTTFGGSDGKITGTTTAMEYKLSTDVTYTAVSATEITGLVAGTYNVRYAAKDGFIAGDAVDVVVAVGENSDQTAPTGLLAVAPTSYGLSDGKITDTTILMEYKLSTDSNYTAATATETIGLVAGTYNVRYAAKTGFNAGTVVDVVVAVGTNADQVAPEGLSGEAPTSYGLSDGKITGTTTLMEYKLTTANIYTVATESEVTGLIAGTYNVRYASKTGFNEGATVDVVVAVGANAAQAAPTGLSAVAPTSYGLSDGKITGTTTLMEYKLSIDSNYTSATATEITGLVAGTYNVRYTAKNGFNAGDVVDVVIFTDNFESEGGDSSYQTAKLIATDGTIQTHAIYPAGDEDWVKFSAEAGNIYQILTSNLIDDPNNNLLYPEMDTYIELYDVDGITLIDSDDDIDYGINLASKIDWNCSATGTYYVRIIHYTHSPSSEWNDTGTGSYDISITAAAEDLLNVADTAVVLLEAAAAEDLTVEGNLTAAENLVTPAKDAIAAADGITGIDAIEARLTTAVGTVEDARTAFDDKYDLATAKTVIQALTLVWDTDLATTINAANTAISSVTLPAGVTVVAAEGTATNAGKVVVTITSGAEIDVIIVLEAAPATLNSTILATSVYDQYTYTTLDIPMTLNGNTLTKINNGLAELVLDTDYTLAGSTVILADSYMQAQAVGDVTLTFTFSAGATDTMVISVSDSTPVESTVSTLSNLMVDGTTVVGFTADKLTYNVELVAGTTVVPTVVAIVTDTEKAHAVVTAAVSLPEATTIVVTAEDGITQATYTINFTVAANVEQTAIVTFTKEPTDLTLTVSKGEVEVQPETNGSYKLETGDYTYTASMAGYEPKTENFSITNNDITAGKTIAVDLVQEKASYKFVNSLPDGDGAYEALVADTVIEVKNGSTIIDPTDGYSYELVIGIYEYTVTATGYLTATGTIVVESTTGEYIVVGQQENISSKPEITSTRQTITPEIGTSVEMTVDASSPDNGTLTYQWYTAAGGRTGDGQLISGATQETYVISSVTANDQGDYWIFVTNTKENASPTSEICDAYGVFPVELLTSKEITNFNFDTIYATQAKVVSKTITTSDFGAGKNRNFIITDNAGNEIPVNLNWNIPLNEYVITSAAAVGSAVESVIQDYFYQQGGEQGLMNRTVCANGYENQFYISTFATGTTSSLTVSGTDALFFFDTLQANGTNDDTSRNRTFTVNDGTNIASILLEYDDLDMTGLVNDINWMLSQSNVSAIAEEVDESHFKLVSNTNGIHLTIDGPNKDDFFNLFVSQ